MLDIMRRKKQLKAVLWVVIFGLAVGMLLFFVPSINRGSVAIDTSAATVNGQPIPMKNFVTAYRKTVENYSNRGKNKIDPETLKAMGISKQVLDSLIAAKVIEVIADRLGIKVTPDEIRQAIETHPNLQDQGKFIGVERYKALLDANNISVSDFEEDVRYLQLVKKIRNIIADSLDVSDRELRDEFARTSQQTQVDFVFLKKEDFEKRVKPTEAELRSYFDGHKDNYKIKEKRRAQYLLVPISQILPSIKATEEEIRQEWDQRPHEEIVEAAHILFKIDDPSKEAEVKKKAEEVLKKAKAGEDFAELARKYSQDPGSASRGGSLGPFARGNMVKEFEDVAFSLKPGEISDLVRTQYGYHIIKVSRHETPTFESNHSGLITSVQIKKAQEVARQKTEEAARLLEKQKDLSLAAKNLGVATEIKETSLFAKDDNPFGIGISQALRDDVFGLKEINSIGHVVEHPLGYAIPKLLEVQLPKPGEFTGSRNQVEKDYADFKAKEIMQAEAKKLSEEAAKQGSLAKAAKEMGFTAKTSQQFKKDGIADPELGSNPAFNEAAFELAPASVSNPIPILNRIAVLQVKSRTPFDELAFQKQKTEIRDRLLQSIQEAYFQEYTRKAIADLEKAGKIRVNPKALEQVEQVGY